MVSLFPTKVVALMKSITSRASAIQDTLEGHAMKIMTTVVLCRAFMVSFQLSQTVCVAKEREFVDGI